ncbi:class C sortase [Enterococcus sp. LJL98]
MPNKQNQSEKLKKERLNLMLKLLMSLLFLTGAIVFSYPFVSDAINNYYDQKNLEKLQIETEKQNIEQLKKQKAALEKENQALLAQGKLNNIPGMGLVEDPFDAAVGQAEDPGVAYFEKYTVGAVYIPTINVSLPLFRETNNQLLEKGATILQGTSFPIGGVDTHSVITGHSGLPDKKLFTDLEKLKMGDLFFIDIAGEKLAYQVMAFATVLPNELDAVKIKDGEDLVTLLTCTPYMINTHRLLVTGERVPYPEETIKKEIKDTQTYHKRRFQRYMLAIPLFFLSVFYWMWRKFVYYQSIKYRYNLAFYVFENGQPQKEVPFRLMDKKGKEAIEVSGHPLIVRSDDQGWVCFSPIPGGRYTVVCQGGRKQKIRAKIYFLKAEYFQLKVGYRQLKKRPSDGRYIIDEVKNNGEEKN